MPVTGELGDTALVAACQSGDEDAFRLIVERYRQRLYAVAYGVLRNREDALEAVQHTFIKMYQSIDGFQSRSGLFTWLYRICFNASIDLQRQRARRPAVEFDETVAHDDGVVYEGRPQAAANPRRELEHQELGETIQAAIDTLPDTQREVIVLREISGLSYKEIADICGCSVGTVMSRLHYGRKRLQHILKEYL